MRGPSKLNAACVRINFHPVVVSRSWDFGYFWPVHVLWTDLRFPTNHDHLLQSGQHQSSYTTKTQIKHSFNSGVKRILHHGEPLVFPSPTWGFCACFGENRELALFNAGHLHCQTSCQALVCGHQKTFFQKYRCTWRWFRWFNVAFSQAIGGVKVVFWPCYFLKSNRLEKINHPRRWSTECDRNYQKGCWYLYTPYTEYLRLHHTTLNLATRTIFYHYLNMLLVLIGYKFRNPP